MEKLVNEVFAKLEESDTGKILEEPETGMGYQIITGSNIESIVIAGSSWSAKMVDLESAPIIDEQAFEPIEGFPVQSLYSKNISSKLSVVHNSTYTTTKGSTVPTPPFAYISEMGDKFIRLSAFRNDRRVKRNGEVLPGTYATSLSDLNVVPSGIAAVGRYALPNRLAAYHVFEITPPVGTVMYFGTVTPNYGLCGGGVEVFFPRGCPSNSARWVRTIPII